jgi:hypothetical protein
VHRNNCGTGERWSDSSLATFVAHMQEPLLSFAVAFGHRNAEVI